MQYHIEHQENNFLILYKSSTHQFTLYKVSAGGLCDFTLDRAEKLIVFDSNEHIVDLEIFRNYIAVFMKKDSFSMLKCYNMLSRTNHTVTLPNRFCSIKAGSNFVSFMQFIAELRIRHG